MTDSGPRDQERTGIDAPRRDLAPDAVESVARGIQGRDAPRLTDDEQAGGAE